MVQAGKRLDDFIQIAKSFAKSDSERLATNMLAQNPNLTKPFG